VICATRRQVRRQPTTATSVDIERRSGKSTTSQLLQSDIACLLSLRRLLIPRLHDEAGSTSWLYERTTSARRALVEQLRECLQYYTIQMTRFDERLSSQLVEPASWCKRGITQQRVTTCNGSSTTGNHVPRISTNSVFFIRLSPFIHCSLTTAFFSYAHFVHHFNAFHPLFSHAIFYRPGPKQTVKFYPRFNTFWCIFVKTCGSFQIFSFANKK